MAGIMRNNFFMFYFIPVFLTWQYLQGMNMGTKMRVSVNKI